MTKPWVSTGSFLRLTTTDTDLDHLVEIVLDRRFGCVRTFFVLYFYTVLFARKFMSTAKVRVIICLLQGEVSTDI